MITNRQVRLFAWLTLFPILVMVLAELNKSLVIWNFRIVDLVDLVVLAPFYLWVLLRIQFTLDISDTGTIRSFTFIACFLYGHAMHVTANAINTFVTEVHQYRAQIPNDAYDLIYFLDEDLSHLIMFGAFFSLLIHWSVIEIPRSDTSSLTPMLVLGVLQGIAQSIAMIEATKPMLPFIIAITVLVMLFRPRSASSSPAKRYVVSAAITMLLTPIAYWFVFGSLEQPSELLSWLSSAR